MNMNTQINDKAQYYSPSDTADILSGGTDTFEFRGLDGDIFAFNRINIGCEDMTKLNLLTATAKLNKRRITLFEDVQLEALHRLFQYHSLRGGIVIEQNKTLELIITNNDPAALDIGIDLAGYDQPAYDRKKQQYEQRGEPYPEPTFLYATATIAAAADQQRVPLNLPVEDCILQRIIVSSTGDDFLKLSLNVDNTEIMPIRYVTQVNNQFQTMDIIDPLLIRRNLLVDAFVTNLDAVNPYDISIFCEAYKYQE